MPNTKNFGYSTVLTAPSPASSGTSLVVQSGDGAKFPSVPFNVTVWPAGVRPTTANAEIVTVTGISTDTFTIVRAQEGSSARSVIVGDQIAATITANSVVQTNRFIPQSATTQDIVLDASADFLIKDLIEVGSANVLEVPATSTLEVAGDARQGGGTVGTQALANASVTPSKLSTGAANAYVTTLETTTSTSYTDLTTVGPSVTVTIGSNGLAILIMSSEIINNTTADYGDVSFVASGANTITIGTNPYRLWGQATAASTPDYKLSYATLLTGLTAGVTTFKLQYKVISGGTASFQFREISVIPL